MILRLRPCFDFDYLIKSFALWACEWIECTLRHGTPPASSRMLIAYGTFVWAVAQLIRSISVASSASAFEVLTRFDTGVCSKSQPPSSDRRQMSVLARTREDTGAAINNWHPASSEMGVSFASRNAHRDWPRASSGTPGATGIDARIERAPASQG